MKKFFIKLIPIIIIIFMFGDVKVEAKTYDSEEKIINVIRSNLIERKKEFTINTTSKIGNKMNSNGDDYIKKALLIDKKGTAKDADYLMYSVKNYRIFWKISKTSTCITFTIDYYLNATQEKKVDSKVKSIIKNLNIEALSDYKKAKALHDYVINLAKYDESYSRYTAYDIFFNKTAVCQGYTLAAYRLFTEAGLPCKIITGYAGGSNHSWNIVKVNGKWYNIDLTWDDPITYDGEQLCRYNYFLKNDSDFSDHTRASQFKTKEFINKYVISKNSY